MQPRIAERVAVLSDVHGVLPVLEAVLDEPDVRSADLVVVAGDHVAGPQPVPVLERLLALGERALLVRGNADRELVGLARGVAPGGAGGASSDVWPIDAWAAAQLGAAHVDALAAMPHPATIEVSGFGSVLVCHGTPRDDDEVVLVDTRPSRWLEAFAAVPAQVRIVVCGHTHMPYVRMVDRRIVVNPGSIGMPYGSRPGGSWALLAHGQVQLRHTDVDVEAAIAAVVAGSTYPDARAWAQQHLRVGASDLEAVAAFGPATDADSERPGARPPGRTRLGRWTSWCSVERPGWAARWQDRRSRAAIR